MRIAMSHQPSQAPRRHRTLSSLRSITSRQAGSDLTRRLDKLPDTPAEAARKVSFSRWLADLMELTDTWQEPAILVTRVKRASSMTRPASLGERVERANVSWLKLCEREADEVEGRAFSEIDGFQGKLTSEASKLALASLLVTEQDTIENIRIVNYTGRNKQPVVLQLRVHILRWLGENLAFLCCVNTSENLCDLAWNSVVRMPVGSARAAIAALGAASQSGEAASARIPFMWRQLIDRHSEMQVVESAIGDDGGDICTICICSCQAGDRSRVLPCGHRFHVQCIDSWFSSQLTGPSNQDVLFQPLSRDVPGGSSPIRCPTCKRDPLNFTYERPGDDLPTRMAEPCRVPSAPSRPRSVTGKQCKFRVRQFLEYAESVLSQPISQNSVVPYSVVPSA